MYIYTVGSMIENITNFWVWLIIIDTSYGFFFIKCFIEMSHFSKLKYWSEVEYNNM
jgi:hypothetical protein